MENLSQVDQQSMFSTQGDLQLPDELFLNNFGKDEKTFLFLTYLSLKR